MLVEIIIDDIRFMVEIASDDPKKDFLDALEKGEKLFGISLRKEHDIEKIPYETISILIDEGFDINSLDSEVYPNELYKLSPSDYFLINMFLAKKGNPKLEIKEIKELKEFIPQIELGKTGCFIH